MRSIHEATLLIGVALLAGVMFRHSLALPRAPIVYFAAVLVPFALSAASGVALILRPRALALASRLVLSGFVAVIGVAFMVVAGINDLWLPLSYPLRFFIFLSLVCLLFVAPWVATDFRVLHRSPLAFDSTLAPFLALGLYQLSPSHFDLALFWSESFWLALGLPTIIATYFTMRFAQRRGRSTLIPLAASTTILYVILAVTYGSIIHYRVA